MSGQEVKEPRFLSDLHRVRSKLAKIPREQYEQFLQRALEKYHKRLGHLYVES